MAILTMANIERHEKDNVLFPSFDLKVEEEEITAICSSLNVRHILLDMLIGKLPTLNGEIRINNTSFLENKTAYFLQLGICFFEDGVYERLTVSAYFKFIQDLYEVNRDFDQILQRTQLQDKKHKKIKDLTFSEVKRVQYGRMLIQSPALFIFEEPDLNVDMETKRVFINITQKLREEGKSILLLTGNMESAITIADQVYRLDEDGLQFIELEAEKNTTTAQETEKEEKNTQPIQFHKIPTKVNDKIVLFDPPEIDYIESYDGQANIYIKGEAFPSSLTLTNLEERLQHFGFFRCHRSYIVNLQKVREVITWTRNSYSLILDDKKKSQVPLSKLKMAELKDLLGMK